MFHVSTTMRRRLLVVAGLAAMAAPFAGDIAAQQAPAAPAPAAILHQPTDARLQGFRWRSIGPTGQGGRIDDIAADEKNPSTYYIGFAVSGLWKTVNNGTTFENIFGEYNHSIGDIAIAPSNSNILYVGTGEPNNRQSSSFGDGMYKSTDAGKTWAHIGLRETQSIGRVVVHPRNPDIVWVAAVGHLFGPNEERGVFMTIDGGKTWTKTLYINQDTGATDLVVDPSNPNMLFAATYERRRTSWGFVGGGPGSGLHQSIDGGKTWKKVTGGGLPRGTMGRIGLDFSRSNPNVIYAQIEVAPDKEPAAPAAATPAPPADPAAGRAGGGGGGGGRQGGAAQTPDPTSSGVWRSADKGKTWTFQSNENQRPMYYSQIRVDPSNENYVFVGGVGPRKSLDGGKTWINLPNMGHVDNHAIWINPTNGRHVMYGNDGGLDVSYDQGETWDSVRLWAVGLPYHVSVDMRRPYNVCTGLQDNGSWCGPSGQRSGDIRMWNWMSVGGGDGFQTMVDPNDPNIFYTESQNGNITRYNLNDGTTANIRPRIGGAGRGGGGGGGGAAGSNVMNDLPADQVMQYNWNSPMRISPHNPNTILFGGRHFFVSRNRGDSWTMSPVMGKNIDISQRNILEQSYGLPNCGRTPGVRCILSRHDGYVQNEYGTVVELEESPRVPGIYWVGTDDGNLQLSRDGGVSWTEVGKNIPGGTKEYHISGIEASKFDAATAYVALDGHRANDHAPYVFKTTDYGKTWTSIAGDLPRGNVNSIRQDPVAKNLLYAPTEYGFYISLNEGTNWIKFMPNIPNVRVDEVLVHPRENDLVLATHGYSIWIMDDITALQQLALAAPTAPTLYKPREAVQWKADRRNQTEVPGSKYWAGDNMPRGTAISYFLPAAATDVVVKITNTATGTDVRTCTGTGNAGMNRFQWTLAGNAGPGGPGGGRQGGQAAPAAAPATPAAPGPCAAPAGGGGRQGGGGGGFPGGGGGIGPGVYKVTLSVAGKEVGSQTFNVLEDIWLNQK